MNAEQTRSGGSAMTQGFDLSPRAQAALVEVMACEGRTPAEVIESAALALRDEATGRARKVSVDLPLGWGTHAHTSEIGRPRLTITGPGVRLNIVPAWDIPSADEVDALERIYEACGDAVHRFRTAYKVTAQPTERHDENGGSAMTSMDDGPEGPVQTVDPGAPTVDEVTWIDSSVARRKRTMSVEFVRKTALSRDTNCPALYRTDRNTFLVQGRIVNDMDVLACVRNLGRDEVVVEVPADALPGEITK